MIKQYFFIFPILLLTIIIDIIFLKNIYMVISVFIIQLFIFSLILRGIYFLIEKYKIWLQHDTIHSISTIHVQSEPQQEFISIDIYEHINNFLNKCSIIEKLEEDCIICLEKMSFGVQLQCNHIFHRHCLDQLIEYEYIKCPLCRANIV